MVGGGRARAREGAAEGGMVLGRRNQRERAAGESGRRVPKMPRPDWLLTRHSVFLRFFVLVLNEMVLVLVIETNRLRRRFLSTSERVVLNR